MSVPIDILDVLRSGLPGHAPARRHVVIVGAGIAGLTAGLLLKEAGHRVTILEARNRLGGRILVIYPRHVRRGGESREPRGAGAE